MGLQTFQQIESWDLTCEYKSWNLPTNFLKFNPIVGPFNLDWKFPKAVCFAIFCMILALYSLVFMVLNKSKNVGYMLLFYLVQPKFIKVGRNMFST